MTSSGNPRKYWRFISSVERRIWVGAPYPQIGSIASVEKGDLQERIVAIHHDENLTQR
ncbi:MAG TPA: hypothetical protein VHL58_01550 [Thermoanaerobaculia bacterium]|nr:hypothetical protein [Thermoanaerobaculia bacterium]